MRVDVITAYKQLTQASKTVGFLVEADNLPEKARRILQDALAAIVMAKLELVCPYCQRLMGWPENNKG